VQGDGTMLIMTKNPESELDENLTTLSGKIPMKVLISNSASASINQHLKFPPGRVQLNNVNDSMNLRDFMENGGSFERANRKPTGYASSVDVRRWK